MIRTKPVEVGQKTEESTTSLEAWRKIEGENVVPQTEVLINSRPIHKHFPRPADRELIMRPLRLTGLIGHYNIFALTSGGGTTGQAGAVALGVARGLATHRPELREILQKG
jgi:small subunit ribosomal protein S9